MRIYKANRKSRGVVGRCSVVEDGKRCDFEGFLVRGMCRRHYGRWYRHGNPLLPRESRIKLDEEKVREMRRLYYFDTERHWTYRDLAARYGVAEGTVAVTVNGRNWKWVK